MKKLIGGVIVGAIMFGAAVGIVEAKGKLETSISMQDSARIALDGSSDVSFDVTRSFAYDRETIWVTNKCFDADGNVVTKVDRAVQWGTWESLEGVAGPFPTGGDSCVAYTTLRPWQDRMGAAFIEYTP